MQRNIYFILALSLLIFGSCKKTETASNTLKSFSFVLSGSNHVPPVATSATGTVTGTYDTSTKTLSFTLTYTGMTPTAGHIHKGAVGTTGPVALPFLGSLTSPYAYSIVLTASQEADLFATNYYVNLHSSAFPSGELRGQISVQ